MVGHRILIVEDETMIVMMVEDFLQELGWDVVGWAGGTERALAMAGDADIDAALLDVNLSGQDTFAVADILNERRIPLFSQLATARTAWPIVFGVCRR